MSDHIKFFGFFFPSLICRFGFKIEELSVENKKINSTKVCFSDLKTSWIMRVKKELARGTVLKKEKTSRKDFIMVLDLEAALKTVPSKHPAWLLK